MRVSRTYDLRAAEGKFPRPTHHFGIKTHVGVDSKSRLVHSLEASVADKRMLPDLLHREEKKVWGDGAYQGQGEAPPIAQDMTHRQTKFKNYVDELQRAKNTTK